MEPLTIRNRKITAEDLPVIQAVVSEYWNRGRTHISRELCKYWNWVQPSGRLKDMACRELLLTLHRKGLINYPPSRFTPKNVGRTTARICVDQTPINFTLAELGLVRVEMVRYTEHESLYNSLVDQFHYLGYSQIVGNHLKYMAFCGDVPLACIGWGSAAWAVQSREQFIGWPKPAKKQCSLPMSGNAFPL